MNIIGVTSFSAILIACLGLFALSIIIALPIERWITPNWLHGFAYCIGPSYRSYFFADIFTRFTAFFSPFAVFVFSG